MYLFFLADYQVFQNVHTVLQLTDISYILDNALKSSLFVKIEMHDVLKNHLNLIIGISNDH